jgi:hypothetical protein
MKHYIYLLNGAPLSKKLLHSFPALFLLPAIPEKMPLKMNYFSPGITAG